MAGGDAGVLSLSSLCWGADHLWVVVAPGLANIGNGGAALMVIVARPDWRWRISCLLQFDRLY